MRNITKVRFKYPKLSCHNCSLEVSPSGCASGERRDFSVKFGLRRHPAVGTCVKLARPRSPGVFNYPPEPRGEHAPRLSSNLLRRTSVVNIQFLFSYNWKADTGEVWGQIKMGWGGRWTFPSDPHLDTHETPGNQHYQRSSLKSEDQQHWQID
jgi:hypothetical protein